MDGEKLVLFPECELGAKQLIGIAKLAAAIYTASGSMLAEAIHSFSDCANQVLLFIGLHQAKRPASRV